MQQRLLNENGTKTWIVVLDTGDEVMKCLLDFANEQHLSAARISGIGAFQNAVLGYFDWASRNYRRNPVERQVEVVSLLGDVALENGAPKMHLHVVLAEADGRALGGHLLEAHVRPTLEIMLTETPAHLQRHYDAASGIALIRPAASAGPATS